MLPPSHLQSFDAYHVQLKGMSKSWSSNVDGRCDGAEMSVRDQRVGTSYSDRVREDVSLEYVMLSQQILHTSESSEALGEA